MKTKKQRASSALRDAARAAGVSVEDDASDLLLEETFARVDATTVRVGDMTWAADDVTSARVVVVPRNVPALSIGVLCLCVAGYLYDAWQKLPEAAQGLSVLFWGGGFASTIVFGLIAVYRFFVPGPHSVLFVGVCGVETRAATFRHPGEAQRVASAISAAVTRRQARDRSRR